MPPQRLVKREFNPFLSNVFHIGKAHDMRSRFALRVLPLVFLALVNALDVERGNGFPNIRVNLSLQPDKRFIFVLQALVEFGRVHVEQLGQLAQACWIALYIFRNGPNARRRNTGCQNQTIAVQHPSPVGRQRQCSTKSNLSLALKKVVGNDLDITGARHQR